MRILPVAGEPGYMSPFELAVGLSDIYHKHLGPCERLCLASAALMSLDRDTAEQLAESVLYDARQGAPVPPFDGLRAEARDWAAFASRGEVRAYLGACWNRLPEAEQARFLSAVRSKRRAA